MQLSDKYPFLTNYFEKAINNKLSNKGVPITHSILFYGQDLESQLVLAKEIARHLNCTGDRSDNCNCLNCRWIRENQHPAVMLITPKDNKPADDESKTVISIKQANMIKNSLLTTSDYYRVFIFFDKDDSGVKGLSPLNFQEETANSMLKMIEEPNDRVLFIFITNSKEDVLPTILSRCQIFNLSCVDKIIPDYSNIENIFSNYWEISRNDVFEVAQKLENLANEIESENVIKEIEHYIYSVLQNNPNNLSLINDLKFVEKARKQISLGISSASIFESLCLNLIK